MFQLSVILVLFVHYVTVVRSSKFLSILKIHVNLLWRYLVLENLLILWTCCCIDSHRQRIVNWINATGGTSSAFDVTSKVISALVLAYLLLFHGCILKELSLIIIHHYNHDNGNLVCKYEKRLWLLLKKKIQMH